MASTQSTALMELFNGNQPRIALEHLLARRRRRSALRRRAAR
jgi:hypothetical protein